MEIILQNLLGKSSHRYKGRTGNQYHLHPALSNLPQRQPPFHRFLFHSPEKQIPQQVFFQIPIKIKTIGILFRSGIRQKIQGILPLSGTGNYFIQSFTKLRVHIRLQQIICHSQLQGLLGKCKITVGRNYHRLNIRILLSNLICRLQPVHSGHFNIQKNDVGLASFQLFHQIDSVYRHIYNFQKARIAFPDYPLQIFPLILFIIRQYHSQHTFSSCLFCLSSSVL